MKPFKPLTLLAILGFSLIIGCGGNRKSFNIGKYEKKPYKFAKKFIEPVGVETNKLSAFTKVAIVEFNVEYLVDMPDSDYIQITDMMYQIFVETVENITEWEIIDRNVITYSPIYQKLMHRQAEKQARSLKRSKEKNEKKSIIFPASPLGILPSGEKNKWSSFYRKSKTEWIEPGVLEEVGAAAALKVHTVVDYFREDEQGKVVIASATKRIPVPSKIEIFIGYDKTPAPGVGHRTADGVKYVYKYKDQCSFYLKKSLISYMGVLAKRGSFDLEEFVYQVEEMFSIYSEMMALELAENL